MGVPFEALLPYAVMVGVRNSPLSNRIQALKHLTDVRPHGSGPFKDQAYAEWRQKSKALDRSMGQAECAYLCGRDEI